MCGMSETVKLLSESETDATVRLTPSRVTDPFRATYRRTSDGTDTLITRAMPSRTRSATRPQASTCPETRCPPKRPPQAMARSRLTFEPGLRLPREVRRSVSGIASAVKCPLPGVTVRQTPLTAILSPVAVPSSTLEASISSTTPEPPPRMERTVPISSIIPVNI